MNHNFGIPANLTITDPNHIPARITALHRGMYQAACTHGVVPAVLKTGSYYSEEIKDFPAVGDLVSLLYNPYGDSLITETHPRRSKFSRNDFSGHSHGYAKTVLEQVVAVNFDYVFIIASLNHDYNLRRIERYLVQAWQSGGTPVVILTKADLAEDCVEQTRAVKAVAAGVDVFAVSAHTGYGLQALDPYIRQGSILVFLGSSGAGKSSLVNALAGEDVMRVSDIREDDSRGRHTTTHRQMIVLPSGAMVIDTPGMRELGMWDAGEGLTGAFGDIEELMLQCRFSDCGHDTEPGCAVRQALLEGALSEQRWNSYRQLSREARYIEDKAAYDRERTEWHKTITKTLRQQYRQRGRR